MTNQVDNIYDSLEQDSSFKKAEGMSLKKKVLYAALGAAVITFGAGAYYYQQQEHNDATPGDSFVGEDGTEWTKLKDDDLEVMFQPQEDDLEFDPDTGIKLAGK